MKIVCSVLAAFQVLLLTSCTENNPTPPVDDHEVITTITLVLVSAAGDTTRATWEDADGEGGAAPNRIDTLLLQPSTNYTGTIHVYNATVDPPDDLTLEIADEDDQHQLIYTDASGRLVFAATDVDENSKPVGLQFTVASGASGVGTVQVNLYHYDNASDKQPGVPGAETDISVQIPYVVQ